MHPSVPTKGISPTLDIQRQDAAENITYILDAKDKRINDKGRTGSPGDHYKQIIYAQVLRLPEGSRLVNALLFPAILHGVTTALLGTHKWTIPPISRSTVVEAALDFETVAQGWLGDALYNAGQTISELRPFSTD
jgi:hypothetical protein